LINYLGDVAVESCFNSAGTCEFESEFETAGIGTFLTDWEFNGAPTAISQRWPFCPCGGFIPGLVTTVEEFVFTITGEEELVTAGFGIDLLGVEFKGAPTAISQRWPGWPCGGFIPEAFWFEFCCNKDGFWDELADGPEGVAVEIDVLPEDEGLVTTELSCGSNSFLHEQINTKNTINNPKI